jgi:hypothetical protein
MAASAERSILFFDDQRLNHRFNVTRHIGKPKLESVYVDPYRDDVNSAWGYPVVFQERVSGKWLMFYNAHVGQPRDFYVAPLIAESADGLSWKPYDTSPMLQFEDRKFPHQLLPTRGHRPLQQVYVDPFASPAERFKGFGTYRAGKYSLKSNMWTSPDGVRWTAMAGDGWVEDAPDSPTTVFWNNKRRLYAMTTRPGLNDRRIALIETTDWKTYTAAETILQPDALDSPLAEFYGMPVVPYEDYFVGLLWVYHTPQVVEGQSPIKYLGGRIDCQLAYSLDGRHFQRGLREPFLANGASGERDAGCIQPYSILSRPDGSMVIYASANVGEHGYTPPGDGSILTYTLRRDGFVYLQSGGGVGRIGTTPMLWEGGEPQLNVQSVGGRVRVRATDHAGKVLPGYDYEQCSPFAGDDAAWRPVWKNGKTLDQMAGKVVRLEIELLNARIYAIRGTFIPMTAGETRVFLYEGKRPKER